MGGLIATERSLPDNLDDDDDDDFGYLSLSY
jgi:hypothetical protein